MGCVDEDWCHERGNIRQNALLTRYLMWLNSMEKHGVLLAEPNGILSEASNQNILTFMGYNLQVLYKTGHHICEIS